MRIYIATIMLLLASLNVQANSYYVATNGNDTYPGTEAQPWKTIQKAANTLTAGDTVFVKSGIYNERIIVQQSGAPDNFIVFSSYQDDTVVIDGSGISWGANWNGLFDVSDKSYIQIIGFTLLNSDYAGIWVENSDHIFIRKNHTYNTFSSGIGVWNSSYTTIENNEVELACNDGEQECITIANSSYCEIKGNNVHDNGIGTNGGEGIDVKEGAHDINVYQNEVHHLNNRLGIYADAWDLHTYNIYIYRNVIHHCSESGLAVASEKGGLIENVNIYNNIIYLNQYGGIELGSWSDIGYPGQKPLAHIKIINNTCYKNGAYNNGWGYGIVVDNPDSKDIIIRNNICSENSAQIAITQIDSGGIVDHNLLFGNNIASGTLYGSDSIIENPLFADTSSYDFHLLSNSPAIDNGSPVNAPDFDFDDNNRPAGAGFDRGAYEYILITDIYDNKNHNGFIQVYPNPALDCVRIDQRLNKVLKVSIFDSTGHLMSVKLLDSLSNNIDLSAFNDGIYFLRIETARRTKIVKILKGT